MTQSGPFGFAVPAAMGAELEAVRAYWSGLRRGGNAIPFWDDVELAALPEGGNNGMLLDVFQSPLRFRLGFIGRSVEALLGRQLTGKFTDEIELHSPLDRLTEQCAACVEIRGPTYYRQDAGGASGVAAYERLVLPMWGNGRIDMLLAAVTSSQGFAADAR